MKISIKPDSVKWEDVREKLTARFPEYKVTTRSKAFLIVAKSGSIGTNVLIRKKNIMVVGNFPTLGGTMLFVLAVVLLGALVPIIVYMAAFQPRMRTLENEVAAYLKEAYADVVIK